MYQLSRAIYREIAPDIEGGAQEHERVLQACEATVQRLIADRHYFARPARRLFLEVRPYLPMRALPRARMVIDGYIDQTEQALARLSASGRDVNGEPLQCRATTRRGTPCQRVPVQDNGYCPSHQHLAETEELQEERVAIAA